MIDNFAPQPYPLEASTDGDTWTLVIGWRQAHASTELVPVLAPTDGGLTTAAGGAGLRYRPATTAVRSSPELRSVGAKARPTPRRVSPA